MLKKTNTLKNECHKSEDQKMFDPALHCILVAVVEAFALVCKLLYIIFFIFTTLYIHTVHCYLCVCNSLLH